MSPGPDQIAGVRCFLAAVGPGFAKVIMMETTPMTQYIHHESGLDCKMPRRAVLRLNNHFGVFVVIRVCPGDIIRSTTLSDRL